ncbi:MAG: HlyD family secretion protein [Bacteroidota bacterium]|nr:HlyD family secretion protein [Bacteroidota bacterium]MDP4231643.1 HlyD family secretion protein [Bacteroidota bacterium]MDP4237424.1 HlyD family secretion protein [Bacteroidota bacterium]
MSTKKFTAAKKVLAAKKSAAARTNPVAKKRAIAAKKTGKKKTILSTLLGVVLLGGAGFGLNEFSYYGRHVDTEDAHIDAEISPVIARIGGYIDSVRFVDNQRVNKGDTLVVLDGRDFLVKLEQAEASLTSSTSSAKVSEANIMTSEATIGAATADVAAAKSMLANASTQSERDAARAQLNSMLARLKVAQKQADSYREQLKSTFSSIDMKKADIDYARLQLSYTIITAPVSGIVSKRMIQPGEYVQAGQSLFSIVNDTSIYVTANFKETQIERMRKGQHVDLHIDAYPDASFEGEVSSFSPATGSTWSLLPAENATGNFVKVVQRVPVKVSIIGNSAQKRMLKPGMNVKAIVSLDQ